MKSKIFFMVRVSVLMGVMVGVGGVVGAWPTKRHRCAARRGAAWRPATCRRYLLPGLASLTFLWG